MNRSGAAPIALGIVVGLVAGLVFGWVVQPAGGGGTTPASLRADFQDEYTALIAAAYAASGDLPRARARLALLPGADESDRIAALAQARLASGRPESEVRALALLAEDLVGRQPTPTVSPAPALPSATPAATPTPFATSRPPPTPLPTPTPGAPFQLESRVLDCDDPAPQPRLQVVVLDASGNGVPNVLVRILWDAGQDQFFTGLKGDRGIGFGDFTIEPDTAYTVQLAESDVVVTGIRGEACPASSGDARIGSWRLTFVQPAAP